MRQFISISIVLVLFVLSLVTMVLGCLSDVEKHFNTGVELQEQGHLQDVIEDFGEVIRLDSQHTDAYYNRALTYTIVGMDAEAEQDFNRAVELGIDPDSLRQEIERLKELR